MSVSRREYWTPCICLPFREVGQRIIFQQFPYFRSHWQYTMILVTAFVIYMYSVSQLIHTCILYTDTLNALTNIHTYIHISDIDLVEYEGFINSLDQKQNNLTKSNQGMNEN